MGTHRQGARRQEEAQLERLHHRFESVLVHPVVAHDLPVREEAEVDELVVKGLRHVEVRGGAAHVGVQSLQHVDHSFVAADADVASGQHMSLWRT